MACSAVTGVSRPISRCMLSVAGFAHEFSLVHSPAADSLIARRLHIAGRYALRRYSMPSPGKSI
jgi:hypothetical protein